MKIPASGKKKALIIVDVQEAFLLPRNRYVIDTIVNIIKCVQYDFYADANFDVGPGSLWEEQEGWTMPDGSDTRTDKRIIAALQGKPRLTIQKSTRSAFKGSPSLADELLMQRIEEVHIVGLASHDCVLATAFDAFDNGFLAYVLEEGCQSTSEDGAEAHDDALGILRHHMMTNHSCRVQAAEVESL